jgi:predicted amidohydrolase YtcJ
LSPKEVIADLLAVIKIHTLNSAYQMHRERDTGSITIGKHADLIVLSQNLFDVPVERISDTKVLMTVVDGKLVYRDAAIPLRP